MKKNASDSEQFPVEETPFQQKEPPELIFFDVDDESEEAEFIRLDDLFAMDSETDSPLIGLAAFTLFPRRSHDLINSSLSRLIRRTLMLTAARFERKLMKVRVRPQFVQWQIEIDHSNSADDVIRIFWDDLEDQVQSNRKEPSKESFWSPNCFVCPVDREFSDEIIIRIASSYQV